MGKQNVLPFGNTGKAETAISAEDFDEVATEDYVSKTVSQLENLVGLIDLASRRVTCDDLFHRVIRQTLDSTDLYPEALAKEVAVSNSTVSRWMNKISAPHPAKKPDVYRKIKKVCLREIKALKKLLAT